MNKPLKNERDEDVFLSYAKKAFLQSTCSKVFSTSEEENADFDEDDKTEVINALNNNIEAITFYHTSNFTRFVSPQISKITIREVIHLTRTNFAKILRKTLQQITDLFNAFCRARYFPDNLKTAKMIFILRKGKPPGHTEGYHRISLLEFFAKIF